VADIELGAFLSGPRNPEHEALLRLIGASILDPRGAEADDEPAAVNTGREWSDAELRNGQLELNRAARGLSREQRKFRLLVRATRAHSRSRANRLNATKAAATAFRYRDHAELQGNEHPEQGSR
jgi:hypothetical protein